MEVVCVSLSVCDLVSVPVPMDRFLKFGMGD
jgi:hypothetical protein